MKYQELAKILKDDIKNGDYGANDKLPTEDNLIENFGISRYCVRQAINILVEQGDVYPVQGSGMFVRQSKREGCMNLGSTRGLTAEFEGRKVHTKVIKIEIKQADESIAQRMHCKVGTWLYYIERIRFVDDEPLSVECTHYNKELIPYIDEKIASASLFGYIKNDLELSLGFADKILFCDKLDYITAGYLGLNVGDPTFVVEDDAYLSNGKLFNASRVYYNYKKTKFFGSKSLVWDK
ncbi:MAG: GntR family transcriptional regulator [Clostridia bacterium]